MRRDYDWGPQGDPADPDSDAWAQDQIRLRQQLEKIDREEAKYLDQRDRQSHQAGCTPLALALTGGACSLAAIYLTHKPQIDQAFQDIYDHFSR